MKIWHTALALAILLALAGACNAVQDTLAHHYSTSIFPQAGQPGRQFWNPAISWQHKYKAWPTDQRPRFPGATTWAVALTDGWHLFKSLYHLFLRLAILLPLALWLRPAWRPWPRHWRALAALAAYAALVGIQGAAFQLLYNHILR